MKSTQSSSPAGSASSDLGGRGTLRGIAKQRRNWIQEERRRTLGDWVAFCVGCGFTVRYFEDSEADVPVECPQCTCEIRRRCPVCEARFPSAFQVACEECSADLRPPKLFGTAIRKEGR